MVPAKELLAVGRGEVAGVVLPADGLGEPRQRRHLAHLRVPMREQRRRERQCEARHGLCRRARAGRRGGVLNSMSDEVGTLKFTLKRNQLKWK